MTKFLLSLVGMGIIVGSGMLVMIFGWGVEPKSWGWILGGSFVGMIVGALFKWLTTEEIGKG